ncbi:hypothetical protein, partial [Ottowia sp.]|uniref:hypothetical protein n=1 Tax=Ottowia sp. TaxID=1898956 RepID=UPI0039E4DF62
MGPRSLKAASERATTRAAWLAFAPPLAVLLLRFALGTLAESLLPAQPLHAARALDDAGALMWQAALPVLIAITAAAALGLALTLAVHAWGWRRVAPWLLGLWLAVCAAAAGALALQYANRAALRALPEATATVVQARPQPASARGPGGAWVLLTLPGDAAPRRVLLEGADARALPPGQRLRLPRAR